MLKKKQVINYLMKVTWVWLSTHLFIGSTSGNLPYINTTYYPVSFGGKYTKETLLSKVTSIDWLSSISQAYIFGLTHDNHTLYGMNSPSFPESQTFEKTPFLARINLTDLSDLRVVAFAEKVQVSGTIGEGVADTGSQGSSEQLVYSSDMEPLMMKLGQIEQDVEGGVVLKDQVAMVFKRA